MRIIIGTSIALVLAAAAVEAQISIPPDVRLTEIASGDVLTAPPVNARDVVLAHLDGDGHLDLFVAAGGVGAFSDQVNALYWGHGDATFTRDVSGQDIVTDLDDSRGIAVGDFDLDGDIDVYVANSKEGQNALYLNQLGQGSPRVFTRVSGDPSTLDTKNARQAVAADVDGDGDLDLYVTNWNGQTNDLFLNTTAGTGGGSLFVKATALQAGAAVTDGGFSFGATFGDIDGDDDLDLFVANHSGLPQEVGNPPTGAPNALYLNDGSGLFTPVRGVPPVLDVRNSLGCAFGDHDGDGDLDLFVGNVQYQTNRLFENDGSGGFTQVQDIAALVDRAHTIDVQWADLNLDGRLELLLANRAGLPFQQKDTLYYYRGGQLVRQGFGPLGKSTTLSGDTYAYAVGDLDGDTLPDLVGVNFDSAPWVFRNDATMWNSVASLSAGGPELSAEGYLLKDQATGLRLTGATPHRPAGLLAQLGSTTPNPTPFGGITLLTSPVGQLLFVTNTDGTGGIEVSTTLDVDLLSDFGMLFQWIVLDSETPYALSSSNGLTVVTP